MAILCVLPARGGSKGIRKKNLCRIGDFTLVERALFTAMGTPMIDRIIVSSDCEETIRLVNKYGNFAPFMRPAPIASDEATSLSVVQHATQWAEDKDRIKYQQLVMLEPTSPFRLPLHVEKVLQILKGKKATSVVTLVKLGDHHPVRIKTIDDNGLVAGFCMDEPEGLRRQDQKPAYIRNGVAYAFQRDSICEGIWWGSSCYGYVMDSSLYSIGIDDPLDMLTAKAFYDESVEDGKSELIEYIPTI